MSITVIKRTNKEAKGFDVLLSLEINANCQAGGFHRKRDKMSVDRRGFIIASAATAIVATSASEAQENNRPEEQKSASVSSAALATNPNAITVDFEYSPLKEAIVGLPYFSYPDLAVAGKWVEEAMKVVPKEEMSRMVALSGKDSVSTGIYDALEQENKALISILKKHNIKVSRPEQLTRERVAFSFGEEYVKMAGISQQYTRDPLMVIGAHVIENTMGSLYRRADILGLTSLLNMRVPPSGASWISMPVADYSTMLADGHFDKWKAPVLEGGDVIVLGKKILVGNSRNPATGSSELGFEWLKNYLRPYGYDVELVRLTEQILHLDVALSVPRPGLIIVCPEALVDGVPAYFKGWDRIEVTHDQAQNLATNGLSIDEKTYIQGYNDRYDGKQVREALEKRGIHVDSIFFGCHIEHGGSIRCSTCPLVRKEA